MKWLPKMGYQLLGDKIVFTEQIDQVDMKGL
jgi:hypothetical protein